MLKIWKNLFFYSRNVFYDLNFAEVAEIQWMMAHPWMTFFLVALAICVVDNIVVNICKTIASVTELRKSAEEPVWHDAKMDLPKTPGTYYGKVDDANHMYPVLYRDGAWYLEKYPQTEMEILQWAEMTDFKGAGDGKAAEW